MSDYVANEIVCKHDLYGGKDSTTLFFRKGKCYAVRIFGSQAVVKDETGCFRQLYSAKDEKFYKQYFIPMKSGILGTDTYETVPGLPVK